VRFAARLLFLIFYAMTYARLGEVGRGISAFAVWTSVTLLTFVSIVVHEAGHAWAVRRVGGTLGKMVAFPFEYSFKKRRLGMAQRGGQHADVGGYVTFKIDRIDPLKRHAIIAVMGPAANVLLTAVAVVVSLTFDESSLTSALLQALAALSLGMAVSNLLPYKGSDGGQIIAALTRRKGLGKPFRDDHT
jgi:Zn-dependent protease